MINRFLTVAKVVFWWRERAVNVGTLFTEQVQLLCEMGKACKWNVWFPDLWTPYIHLIQHCPLFLARSYLLFNLLPPSVKSNHSGLFTTLRVSIHLNGHLKSYWIVVKMPPDTWIQPSLFSSAITFYCRFLKYEICLLHTHIPSARQFYGNQQSIIMKLDLKTSLTLF